MTILRLAGFRAVRITSIWQPGLRRRPATASCRCCENVEAAAQLSGIRVYVSVFHAGSRTTPLTRRDQADFARYAARDRPRVPAVRRRDRRQRAEHQPLLAATVRPGRRERRRADVPLAARRRPTTRSRLPTPAYGSGAARSRRAAATAPGPPATRTRRRSSSLDLGAAYRASGRQTPIMDGLAIHPYGENSSIPPSSRTRATRRSGSPTTRSSSACSRRPSTGARSRARRCRSSTPSTASSRRSRTASGRSTRAASRRRPGPSTRRSRPRTTRRRWSSRSASRTSTGFFVFHTHRRDSRSTAGSRASSTPTGRRRRATGSVRDALARARGGSIARCPGLELPVAGDDAALPGPARGPEQGHHACRLRCNLDCVYSVRLRKLPPARRRSRAAAARKPASCRSPRSAAAASLPAATSTPSQLRHPVNPAAPTVLAEQSGPAAVGARSRRASIVDSSLLALSRPRSGGCGGEQPAALAVGAVDDVVRSQPALLGELVDSGFGAVAVTSIWEPGPDGLRARTSSRRCGAVAAEADASRRPPVRPPLPRGLRDDAAHRRRPGRVRRLRGRARDASRRRSTT